MVTIERSIRIERPVEDVFNYMTRFENDREWRDEVVDIRRTTPTNRGVGERYEQLLELSGRQVPTDFEVTAYENNRHIGFRGTSGDVHAEGSYHFSAEGSATRVDIRAEVEVSGAAQLTEPYIEKELAQQGERDFRRLRQVLESSG